MSEGVDQSKLVELRTLKGHSDYIDQNIQETDPDQQQPDQQNIVSRTVVMDTKYCNNRRGPYNDEGTAAPERVLPPGMIEVVCTFDLADGLKAGDHVQDGDLDFKAGDVILTDAATFAAARDSGGWVLGELNGKQGFFPSSYCVLW